MHSLRLTKLQMCQEMVSNSAHAIECMRTADPDGIQCSMLCRVERHVAMHDSNSVSAPRRNKAGDTLGGALTVSWAELEMPIPVPNSALLSSALRLSSGSVSRGPLVAEPILDVSGLAAIFEMSGVRPMSEVAGLVSGMPCNNNELSLSQICDKFGVQQFYLQEMPSVSCTMSAKTERDANQLYPTF